MQKNKKEKNKIIYNTGETEEIKNLVVVIFIVALIIDDLKMTEIDLMIDYRNR